MCGFIGRHPGGTQLSEDVWFYRPPPGGEGTHLGEHVWFYRPPPGGEGTQLSEHVWFHRPPPWGVLSSVNMCGFIGRQPGGYSA